MTQTAEILITGGAGFIGSHLVRKLLQTEPSARLVVLDDLSTGKTENLPDDPRILLVKGNITDTRLLDEVFANHRFDSVFHLAAVASVQDSIRDPLYTHAVNFDSVLQLLERCRKIEALRRFVFASSAAVYGNEPSLPSSENDAVNPVSPYGVDKYAAERYVLNAFPLFGIPGVAFRFFNVYGPRQNPSSPYSGVLSRFVEGLRKPEPSVTIFGDGEQTRDFVYVEDLVQALLAVSAKPDARGKVFNIGTGVSSSLNRIVHELSEISGKRIQVEYREGRPGDIRHSRAEIQPLRSMGGNALAFRTLREGLDNYLAWGA